MISLARATTWRLSHSSRVSSRLLEESTAKIFSIVAARSRSKISRLIS